MNREVLIVTAIGIVAALSLGSPLNAAPVATKKLIRIDSTARGVESCSGKFILQLGTGGDLGKVHCTRSFGKDTTTPDGLVYDAIKQKTSFTGRDGTFVIVSVGRSYDVGYGNAGNWSGTWSVVSGTGTYAGMRGHGTWVGADNLTNLSLQARFAGIVTLTP
jgi:hypothetical protein